MVGPCWNVSAAGAVGDSAGPVTLINLVGEGHWDAHWHPVGAKEEEEDKDKDSSHKDKDKDSSRKDKDKDSSHKDKDQGQGLQIWP